MDKDLVTFLKQEFAGLEQRIDQRFEVAQQEFAGLEQRMDQRFEAAREETAQQFSAFEQRIDQRFQTSREETAQQIQVLRKEMSQRFDKVEEEVRHAHVSIEGLRGEIRLVAEGVATTNERLDRRIEETDRKVDEVDARHRSAYKGLDHRVRKLEGAA